MDPVVQAAWIQTCGTVFASLVGAAVAGWYGKRWLKQEQLRAQLKTAQQDIAFLLEVEKIYVDRTRDIDHVPGKRSVRTEVEQTGLTWSGQHTPGRVRSNFKT